MQIDPYNILNVSENASMADIKKAFRTLALKWHPDKNPNNPKASEQFQLLAAAYELIGTVEKRKKYHDKLNSSRTSRENGGSGRSYSNFFDDSGDNLADTTKSFKKTFKQGHTEYSFEVEGNTDLDDDFLSEIFGEFSFMNQDQNPFASDDLKKQAKSKQTKNNSNLVNSNNYTRINQDVTATYTVNFWDSILGAEKTVTLSNGEKIKVKIPEGIKNGEKIVLQKMANKFNREKSGDLILEVDIIPDQEARREGSNLFVNMPIDLKIAVLGGPQILEIPIGKFQIIIPPYSSGGDKLALDGHGVKKEGILFVEIQVTLDESYKNWLTSFFKNSN